MSADTVAPAESRGNSETPPSPPPLLAKLCPSPWAGHNLARRGGGRRGGREGMVVVFIFQEKTHQKQLVQKWPEFPLVMVFK